MTAVDAIAGAFAAVLTALVATGTLYLQWRTAKPVSAEMGVAAASAGPVKSSPQSAAAASDKGGSATASVTNSSRTDISMKSQNQRWLTAKRIAFPPLSGIVAGLVVILVGGLLTSNKSPVVNILSPRQGAAVSQHGGFEARGHFSNIGDETLWLTDYDGSGYTVDSQATLGADGLWKAPDSDLGDPGQHLPFRLTARVIIANPRCASKLQATMNTTQDYLSALPGGCTVVGAITVNVIRR